MPVTTRSMARKQRLEQEKISVTTRSMARKQRLENKFVKSCIPFPERAPRKPEPAIINSPSTSDEIPCIKEIIKVKCDHSCMNWQVTCCKCSDLRPQSPTLLYPVYIDGVGVMQLAARDHSYCPYCKTTPSALYAQLVNNIQVYINVIKLLHRE